jgi:hypothetical protein
MATKRAFRYPAIEYPAIEHRPSGAALALAVGIYVAGVAAMAWVNVAVLCRGDPKWGQGCGAWGWLLDMVFVPLLLAPVLIAGFIAARTPRFAAWRPRLYMVSTAATLAVAACLFALPNPMLMVYGIIAGVAVVVNVVRAVGFRLISEDGAPPESR